MIINYTNILLVLFTVQTLAGGVCVAQSHNSVNYENYFFTLDFNNQKYDFSEVEKYFFTTFPHKDPTLGDVIYDRMKWVNDDMIKLSQNDGLYGFIKSRNDSLGFDSFRFTSKPYYNLNNDVQKILFVFKGKFPSEKGVWPAWWLNGSRQDEWLYKKNNNSISDESLDKYSGVGQFYNTPSPVNCTDWPAAGEVDIIETINGNNIIHNTIHTCPQMCDSEWNEDGVIINCANATFIDPNSGCSGKSYMVDSPEGTFACLWENNSFHYYYWDSEADVRSSGGPLSSSPDPESWKQSNLKNQVRLCEGSIECDDESHKAWQCETCEGRNKCEFRNLKMIFNITLCGIWAGYQFDETNNSLNNCKEYK
ncbi:MAG: hypothetical protein MUE91_10555 [Ignavibacteriaceae bacterium]|nr:hypothetical protein [Ignavibacteriaceae bacterium]